MLTDSSDFISYVFYVWVGLYNFKVKLIVFESSFFAAVNAPPNHHQSGNTVEFSAQNHPYSCLTMLRTFLLKKPIISKNFPIVMAI